MNHSILLDSDTYIEILTTAKLSFSTVPNDEDLNIYRLALLKAKVSLY